MDELCEQADNKPLSLDRIKVIDMLTHSIKSIDTVNAMQESGYSNNSYRYNGHSYGYKRMSDGRYSRDSGEDMRMRLETAMREASTEREREAIRKCMEMI